MESQRKYSKTPIITPAVRKPLASVRTRIVEKHPIYGRPKQQQNSVTANLDGPLQAKYDAAMRKFFKIIRQIDERARREKIEAGQALKKEIDEMFAKARNELVVEAARIVVGSDLAKKGSATSTSEHAEKLLEKREREEEKPAAELAVELVADVPPPMKKQILEPSASVVDPEVEIELAKAIEIQENLGKDLLLSEDEVVKEQPVIVKPPPLQADFNSCAEPSATLQLPSSAMIPLKVDIIMKIQCKDCGIQVKPGYMKKHMLKHQVNRQSFKCGFCNKVYYRKSDKMRHERSKHLAKPADENNMNEGNMNGDQNMPEL